MTCCSILRTCILFCIILPFMRATWSSHESSEKPGSVLENWIILVMDCWTFGRSFSRSRFCLPSISIPVCSQTSRYSEKGRVGSLPNTASFCFLSSYKQKNELVTYSYCQIHKVNQIGGQLYGLANTLTALEEMHKDNSPQYIGGPWISSLLSNREYIGPVFPWIQ